MQTSWMGKRNAPSTIWTEFIWFYSWIWYYVSLLWLIWFPKTKKKVKTFFFLQFVDEFLNIFTFFCWVFGAIVWSLFSKQWTFFCLNHRRHNLFSPIKAEPATQNNYSIPKQTKWVLCCDQFLWTLFVVSLRHTFIKVTFSTSTVVIISTQFFLLLFNETNKPLQLFIF